VWPVLLKNVNKLHNMENMESGNNALRNEGIASPEDIENALKAHKEELDEITLEAQKALSEAGGNYESAIEGAELAGNASLREKLQVMQNVEAQD